MNNSIILKRSVIARCWRVVGQIAKAKKRTELIPVLLRAREIGGTDARDLAEHLFFEPQSRRVVGERLLHIAHAYGLVKKKERSRFFTLTETGEKAIDTGKVLVPEDGAWTIWASEDPLLPSPILRIDSWNEPRAFREIKRGNGENTDQRTQESLPAWLKKIEMRPITPAASSEVVRIDHLESKAEAVQTNGSLRLRWNVGDGRLQLNGTLEEKKVVTELKAPSISPDQTWLTLLAGEGRLERWSKDRQQLRLKFVETDDTHRKTMSCDLFFESPKIPDYGEFEPVAVQEVPITPDTEADAKSWAKWRLHTRIQDYATFERYATWCAEAVEPFDQYELELPTRTELFDEFRNRAPNRPEPELWHLAAAEDWDL